MVFQWKDIPRKQTSLRREAQPKIQSQNQIWIKGKVNCKRALKRSLPDPVETSRDSLKLTSSPQDGSWERRRGRRKSPWECCADSSLACLSIGRELSPWKKLPERFQKRTLRIKSLKQKLEDYMTSLMSSNQLDSSPRRATRLARSQLSNGLAWVESKTSSMS